MRGGRAVWRAASISLRPTLSRACLSPGPRPAALSSLLAVSLAAFGGGCSGGAVQVPPRDSGCGDARRLAALPPELKEASGMIRDPRREDLFWLHNDSDNDPALYLVDVEGHLVMSVEVSGGTNEDPEDLALAECGDRWCLYLGDIGDNFGRRREIFVHRILLPPLPTEAGRRGGSSPSSYGVGSVPRGEVAVERSFRLRYPDGPRDAESMIIDERTGQLILISKGREGRVSMYAARLDAEGEEPITLRRIGSLRIPIGRSTSQYLTAADLSADGRQLAVRSYTTIFLFRWPGLSAFDTTAVPAAVSLAAAAEPQGEGLTFAADYGLIYLASEGRLGRPQQLSVVSCPARRP
ncbi:MAG: hypothetical protein ACE5JR_02730 [Gemmatimonadota bacterium]